jgi:hypothetical protein
MEVLPYILKTFLASFKSRNKRCLELLVIISYPRRKGEGNWLGLQYDMVGEN